MLIKAIIILFFATILFNLGKALFFLLKKKPSTQMAKALTWRIGLSIVVFVFFLLAYALGWIKPHGITRYPTKEIDIKQHEIKNTS